METALHRVSWTLCLSKMSVSSNENTALNFDKIYSQQVSHEEVGHLKSHSKVNRCWGARCTCSLKWHNTLLHPAIWWKSEQHFLWMLALLSRWYKFSSALQLHLHFVCQRRKIAAWMWTLLLFLLFFYAYSNKKDKSSVVTCKLCPEHICIILLTQLQLFARIWMLMLSCPRTQSDVKVEWLLTRANSQILNFTRQQTELQPSNY